MLFEVGDAGVELGDGVWGAEAGLAPDLIAEVAGQRVLQLGDLTGEAGVALGGVGEVGEQRVAAGLGSAGRGRRVGDVGERRGEQVLVAIKEAAVDAG